MKDILREIRGRAARGGTEEEGRERFGQVHTISHGSSRGMDAAASWNTGDAAKRKCKGEKSSEFPCHRRNVSLLR